MNDARRGVRVGLHWIAYEEHGSGPPVLLIHGLGVSARYWRPVIGPLATQFRVFALDVLGFGGSQPAAPFTLSAAAVTIRSWLDVAGLERVDVVGHSMGGHIAAALAANAGDRVRRLVLAAPATAPVRIRLRDAPLRLLSAIRYLPPRLIPLVLRDVWRAGPSTMSRAAAQVSRTSLMHEVHRIGAPTLIIWGAHDHLYSVSTGEALAREIPDARLVVLPHAGHNIMWNEPAQFATLVADFLSEA